MSTPAMTKIDKLENALRGAQARYNISYVAKGARHPDTMKADASIRRIRKQIAKLSVLAPTKGTGHPSCVA